MPIESVTPLSGILRGILQANVAGGIKNYEVRVFCWQIQKLYIYSRYSSVPHVVKCSPNENEYRSLNSVDSYRYKYRISNMLWYVCLWDVIWFRLIVCTCKSSASSWYKVSWIVDRIISSLSIVCRRQIRCTGNILLNNSFYIFVFISSRVVYHRVHQST